MGDDANETAAAGSGSGDGMNQGGTPAGDPATQGGSEPSGTHNPDVTGSTPVPATEGGEQPPPAAAKGKNGKGKAKEPPPEPAPENQSGPDLTRRLAQMSRDNRTTKKELRQATEALAASNKRLADFDALIERASKGDDSAIDDIYARFKIDFDRIVAYHAGKPDPTPEERQAQEIEQLRKRLDEEAAARQREKDEAAAAAQQAREAAARAEYVGMCSQQIKAAGEKAEICARLGDEAAEAVFGRVLGAWQRAGQPELMPGELADAIDKAIEVQELEYVKRGQQLAKAQAQANGTNGHANGANGAGKNSDLPPGIAGRRLSETDEQILNGLIDKTAPAVSRAKPRSISSQMGGSAPPRATQRGGQDPRDALRDTLAQAGLTPR